MSYGIKTMDDRGIVRSILVAILCVLCNPVLASIHRDRGYMYLSPLPEAEFTPTGTQYILVRFAEVSPDAVSNLSSFITVEGVSSGNHA